ncbi:MULTISPECIES: hypothetical protein [unclassified Lactococcus]|uniref:hypothetical protein n=1 Tax=unclassified Lactococcus TaxID=2643510 RepID=UPI000ED37868|nr:MULTISPECIES: hypothetical protein [unclassified Lactococcus]HAP15632.1 hypothetical protein [Lactococcus sp.]
MNMKKKSKAEKIFIICIVLIFILCISTFVVPGLKKYVHEDTPITLENTTGTKNWEAKTEKYILNSYTESSDGNIVLDLKDKGEMTFLSSDVNIKISNPPLKQMTVCIQYYSFIPVIQNGKTPLRGDRVFDEVKIDGKEKELAKQTMTWGEIVNDKKIGNPYYGEPSSDVINFINFRSEVPNLTKSISKDIANKISKIKTEYFDSVRKETVVVRPFVTINK